MVEEEEEEKALIWHPKHKRMGKKEKVPLSPLEFLREDERSSRGRRRRKRRRRWKRFISRIHPMTAEERGKEDRRFSGGRRGRFHGAMGDTICLPKIKHTPEIAIERKKFYTVGASDLPFSAGN